MIDVCVCTHAPDKNILKQVFEAFIKQTLNRKDFSVIIVDNVNKPELSLQDAPYSMLLEAGVNTRIIKESQLGIAPARIRALRESTAEAVVFVDDDNLLEEHFLEHTKKILNENPEAGCFSGRIFFRNKDDSPEWMAPLLRSLAIRDAGDKPIVDWFRRDWYPWVPACTASMVLRRKAADAFLRIHAPRPEFSKFGRRGRNSLMSGEDFLIALSTAEAGLKCGYFPELSMSHYIRPSRFTFYYMAKLMASYAVTELRREIYLKWPPKPFTPDEVKYRLLALDFKNFSHRARFCFWLYQIIYLAGKTVRLAMTGGPFFAPRAGVKNG